MFQLTNPIRARLIAAVVTVAASSLSPVICHASNEMGTSPVKLPADAVAVVNGVAITHGQMNDAIRAVTAKMGQADTSQLRSNVKKNLIVYELLRQNAEKLNYGARPEVQKAAKDARTNTEIQLYLKDNLHPQSVTDEQVKARYDAFIASLGSEDYKASVIAVSDGRGVGKVFSELQDGKSFDAVAREYSVVPSKSSGGELPWVNLKQPVAQNETHGLPLPIAKAVVGLSVGEYTPAPVVADNMLVFVKLDAMRAAKVPSFDEARGVIQQQLKTQALRKASSQLAEDLLKHATVEE